MGKSYSHKYQAGQWVYHKGKQYLVVQSNQDMATLECYDMRNPEEYGKQIEVKQVFK